LQLTKEEITEEREHEASCILKIAAGYHQELLKE
jgi:hypothetical protein